MKTIQIKDTLTITKEDQEQLTSVETLMRSPDYETAVLGYKMLVRLPVYRRCNSNSLYIKKKYSTGYSLGDRVAEYKYMLDNEEYYSAQNRSTTAKSIFEFFKKENQLQRIINPKIDINVTFE